MEQPERRLSLRRSEDREIYEMSREALDIARKADHAISSHEAVCATRFGFIQADLKALRTIVAWGGAILITTLLATIGTLLMSGAHLAVR